MVTIEHRSVFRRGPEGGNPCPVVTEPVRTGQDDLDLKAVTGGRDLPEPELR
jgi:hypothetical protein